MTLSHLTSLPNGLLCCSARAHFGKPVIPRNYLSGDEQIPSYARLGTYNIHTNHSNFKMSSTHLQGANLRHTCNYLI
jgi:hypothetical protein